MVKSKINTRRIKTKAKGNRVRSEGLSWLKKVLNIVDTYTVPESRFSKDAFGVADAFVIWKIKDITRGSLIPVQFKSNTWGETRKYKKWCKDNGMSLIVVRKDDRKPFRLRWLSHDGDMEEL